MFAEFREGGSSPPPSKYAPDLYTHLDSCASRVVAWHCEQFLSRTALHAKTAVCRLLAPELYNRPDPFRFLAEQCKRRPEPVSVSIGLVLQMVVFINCCSSFLCHHLIVVTFGFASTSQMIG